MQNYKILSLLCCQTSISVYSNYYYQLTSTGILSCDIHAGRSATNTGAIVGGAVGGGIILLLVIVLLVILILVLKKVLVIRRGWYSKQQLLQFTDCMDNDTLL